MSLTPYDDGFNICTRHELKPSHIDGELICLHCGLSDLPSEFIPVSDHTELIDVTIRRIFANDDNSTLDDFAGFKEIPRHLPKQMRHLMALLCYYEAFPELRSQGARKRIVDQYFLLNGMVPWDWIRHIYELEKVVTHGRWFPGDDALSRLVSDEVKKQLSE